MSDRSKKSSVLLLALFFFLSSGCAQEKAIEIGKTTLEKDTTWSGVVVVSGDVYVPPGITLTIKPGTMVKFKRIGEQSDQNLFVPDSPYYPEAELIVRGKLIARGTLKQKVVFTSAELNPRAKDWGAINFLGSEGNIIEHAKILCAYNGVHAHGSSVTISYSEFAKNGVAVSFKKEEETPDAPWFGKMSDVTITDSLLSGNKGGIGYRNSKAQILRNIIRDNKFFGIWPKEDVESVIRHNDITENGRGIYLYQARGVLIENNNIFDNQDYNIAVAEAQDYPVNARNNWFGNIKETEIENLLYDKQEDHDVAEIQYKPVLADRVHWEKR
ncbi:MAG: right-handed parallel beta-helix repeat-containing protein [Proteobacteria bacterium]|nr:right-handed parallel beta-helix repeat-containing protein [Pseudomonadota bacterium]MBU1710425.1 right-handed parallel beta-helix repeat-containing protein [Pseudomonadota bacterium]